MMRVLDVKTLLEAGVHFGHQVRRWNPKMAPYIYMARDGIHVIDLFKTQGALREAVEKVREIAASGKPIVFVGTKRQSTKVVEEEAKRAGAHFVTTRWLGGLMTNWDEIKKTIKHLSDLEGALQDKNVKRTKKERLILERQIARLERLVGGLKGLEERPGLLFIVDAHKDAGAAVEGRRCGVPVVAICDTNTDPTLVDYPIPGNDDAMKAVRLMVNAIAEAVIEGKKAQSENQNAEKKQRKGKTVQ